MSSKRSALDVTRDADALAQNLLVEDGEPRRVGVALHVREFEHRPAGRRLLRIVHRPDRRLHAEAVGDDERARLRERAHGKRLVRHPCENA
ncbi:MAG TPA: hypothetical protein PLZ79_04895 [Burkholderiales bacterium]|nr:hypothetical protein [Burkholderiales bacterium]